MTLLAHLAQAQRSETPATAAARARQKAIKTLDVEFELTEVIPKDGMAGFTLQRDAAKGKAKPEKETTIKSLNRLLIDGSMLRYECNHPIWSEQNNVFKDSNFVSVLGKSSAKRYYPDGMLNNGIRAGIILQNAENIDAKSYAITPLIMTFRGLDPSFTPDLISMLTPTGDTRNVRGKSCNVYTRSLSKDLMLYCSLDPQNDYLIVRAERRKQGRVTDQLDIEYKTDNTCKWAPWSWTRTNYSGKGAIWRVSTATVTAMRLNQAQDAGLFDIHFPPGTHVHDQNVQKDYKVQPDGTMHEINILTGMVLSETRYQPGTPWYQRHWWMLSCISAAGLLVALYVVRQRQRCVSK